jgi:hypothetical protein
MATQIDASLASLCRAAPEAALQADAVISPGQEMAPRSLSSFLLCICCSPIVLLIACLLCICVFLIHF